MIDLDTGELKDLLPPFFSRQAEVSAFSAALKIGLSLVEEYGRRTAMYADIEGLPEYLLDYIAVEMNAEYYSEDLDIETKRAVIKKAIYWKMKAGTKAAVEELIQTIFGEGEIIEWKDFKEGKKIPGTFDIETSEVITKDAAERFGTLIKETKNASSHLRYVEAKHDTATTFVVARKTVQEDETTILNDIHINNTDQAYIYETYIGFYDFGEGMDEIIVGLSGEEVEMAKRLYYACYLIQNSDTEIYKT